MNIKSYFKNYFKKYWWIGALFLIFIFAFHIRAINITPDRILSYDPTFQYRFTKYVSDWGAMPLWDELTYYPGRAINNVFVGPLMFYLTSLLHLLLSPLGFSLLTTASYASALYGALIVIPAFLLGRELSNNYGGLLTATLIGTAPQILIRTFGSSYDTDQIVLFFMVLTIYLGIYALRRRTIFSYSMLILGFVAFMAAWNIFWFTYFFVLAVPIVYFLMLLVLKDEGSIKLGGDAKHAVEKLRQILPVPAALFIAILVIGALLMQNPLEMLLNLIGFVGNSSFNIVNVSIAELQDINLVDIGAWIKAMGNFVTGDGLVDTALFFSFIALSTFGIVESLKGDKMRAAFLITLAVIGFYTTTRGIRFTEFSSALSLALVGAGFGLLIEKYGKEKFGKSAILGYGLVVAVIALSIGLHLGQSLGPDVNGNWESAWEFLKTQTPELSLVGTWWDPGHMITGLAERRVVADGAHCSDDECKYGINARIVDLGKIMATGSEEESINLIKKYKGTSPKVYWIASDDLIGKFQWLQFFGTGCDARKEQEKCPLYYQIPLDSVRYRNDGNIGIRNFGSIISVDIEGNPLPFFTQGGNAAIFQEVLYFDGTQIKSNVVLDEDLDATLEIVKPLVEQLGYTLSPNSVPVTLWIPSDQSYVVLIPQNLRNSVFTRMFFLEGNGLNNFTQVFRNEQVKIYEVNL